MNCAMNSTKPALSVTGLSKQYRKKKALANVSFCLDAASLTVILGPAGAGKTTTLRLIAGLESPDSGSICLGDEDALPLQPKDRDVAMIFDNIALYPNKTGFGNIASPLRIRKEPKEVIEQKVNEIAKTLKISNVLERLPKTMSGGERQRVALGRALIRSPRLFLLDEPLSSLDAKLRIELRAELKRLQRELGYTFLLTTPDFQEALAIADQVIMLREGEIVQVAPPQELYDNPADREVARFIGAPQINIVNAGIHQTGHRGRLTAAGSQFPVPPQFAKLDFGGAGKLELAIRPENLEITDPEKAEIRAKIVDIEPLGLQSVLTAENDEAELRLTVASSVAKQLHLGEAVGLSIPHPERLLAFHAETGIRLN